MIHIVGFGGIRLPVEGEALLIDVLGKEEEKYFWLEDELREFGSTVEWWAEERLLVLLDNPRPLEFNTTNIRAFYVHEDFFNTAEPCPLGLRLMQDFIYLPAHRCWVVFEPEQAAKARMAYWLRAVCDRVEGELGVGRFRLENLKRLLCRTTNLINWDNPHADLDRVSSVAAKLRSMETHSDLPQAPQAHRDSR